MAKDSREAFLKKTLRRGLLETGRRLVVANGADFLTARKLSEASHCSVGSIYNLFSNMDAFILELNLTTLDALYARLQKLLPDASPYINLNRYMDVFVAYLMNNRNLWKLLFDYHLRCGEKKLPLAYLRRLNKITALCEGQFNEIFTALNRMEKKLSWQVLWQALFSLASFLSAQGPQHFNRVSQQNICKLLLNTYLGGMAALKRS